jgi:hypothetical protein
MPQVIYTFSFDTETKQAIKSGNITTQHALHLLTDILVAEMKNGPKTGSAQKSEKEESQNIFPEIIDGN